MPEIRLTDEELRYISLFETLTGVAIKDCVVEKEENRIIFIVEKGKAGLAIGKDGKSVKILSNLLGKAIEVVEFGDTLEELVKSCLFPAKVHSVRVVRTADGRRIAIVTVAPSDKGFAIGRGGRKIGKARTLAKRYFDVNWITIA